MSIANVKFFNKNLQIYLGGVMFLLQSDLVNQYHMLISQLCNELSHLPNRDDLIYKIKIDIELILSSNDGIIVCSEIGQLSHYDCLQNAHEDMLHVGYDRVMFYGESNPKIRVELDYLQGELEKYV